MRFYQATLTAKWTMVNILAVVLVILYSILYTLLGPISCPFSHTVYKISPEILHPLTFPITGINWFSWRTQNITFQVTESYFLLWFFFLLVLHLFNKLWLLSLIFVTNSGLCIHHSLSTSCLFYTLQQRGYSFQFVNYVARQPWKGYNSTKMKLVMATNLEVFKRELGIPEGWAHQWLSATITGTSMFRGREILSKHLPAIVY